MKTIIAGGRSYWPTSKDKILVNRIHALFKITEVVCGCATGADTWGEYWALSQNIPVKSFPANWDLLGKSAGYIRNRSMAEYADALILFPGGRGSANMANEALRKNLLCFFYRDFADLIDQLK